MLLENLGKRIRARREERGFKQVDLSRALGVSAQAVSKWERGENAPDITLLAPLAKLLDMSLDRLLGATGEDRDVFEATVFVTSLRGYAKKSKVLSPRDLATWVNGIFYRLTESVLMSDGIPVKQTGDGLLAFFSGPHHRARAIKAGKRSLAGADEAIGISLATGEIFLGSIGHPDYQRPDITGNAVNIAFGLLATVETEERKILIADKSTVLDNDENKIVETLEPVKRTLSFTQDSVTSFEIE